MATVSEIDDAIRFGAGLRWAFMGTFLTYRIGGGEHGMRHFIEQFGPTLSLPWTRLMDVPELDEELVDKLVAQSDAQAAGRSIRELERMRDDCLVAIIQGLRAQGEGAGAVLAEYERGLLGAIPDGDERVRRAACCRSGSTTTATCTRAATCSCSATRPTRCCAGSASTSRAAATSPSRRTSRTCKRRRRTSASRSRPSCSTTTRSACISTTSFDAGDDALLATAEQMLLHVDAGDRRTAPAPPEVLERVERLADDHATLPRPERAGRAIGCRRDDRRAMRVGRAIGMMRP